MKVELDKNSLVVMPETDFERQLLEEMFPVRKENDDYRAFPKYGLSCDRDSLVGLKIVGIKQEGN